MTRILIADDHATFRRALRTLLESLDGMEIVAEEFPDVVTGLKQALDDYRRTEDHRPRYVVVGSDRQNPERGPGAIRMRAQTVDHFEQRSVAASRHDAVVGVQAVPGQAPRRRLGRPAGGLHGARQPIRISIGS